MSNETKSSSILERANLFLLVFLHIALPLVAILATVWAGMAVYHQVSQRHPVDAGSDVPSIAVVQQAADQASHGAVKVTRVFPGVDGLVGAVVTDPHVPDARNIVWFTRHLDAVMVNGHVLDAKGQDLTQGARYTWGLLWRPAKVLATIAAHPSHVFTVGSRGPVVTAFFDPNCSFCHQLYQQLAPAIHAGALRLQVVLVGIVKPSSVPRAASILAARDPAAALARNERDFDDRQEEGGAPIKTSGIASATGAVSTHLTWFRKAGASGTPTLLYCSRRQRHVVLTPGLPRDLDALVKDLAPVSECEG